MADKITATVDDEGNTVVTIPPQIMVRLLALPSARVCHAHLRSTCPASRFVVAIVSLSQGWESVTMADEITATVDDEGNTIVTIPPQIMVPLVAGRSLTGGDHGQ